jgi:hypothetical protein
MEMNEENILKKIEAELSKREKQVINKNAIDALCSCFGPVKTLRKVFSGRGDAIDRERQKITIETILELLIKIDNAISANNGKTEGINWEDVGHVLTNVTCEHCKSRFGMIVEVGNELRCPNCAIDWKIVRGKIEAYGENTKEVTGMDISSDAGPVELKPGTHIKASGKNVGKITGLRIGTNSSDEGDN